MRSRPSLQQWVSKQWQSRGLLAGLLRPVAWVFGRIVLYRQRASDFGRSSKTKLSVPVVVIGNIYVGGTGKTPVACEIARLLQSQGWNPGLVSRGYGRQESPQPATGQGPDLAWESFGDEPALIARKTGMPVSSHRNRTLAAKQLLAQYPATDIIISDDGLQHYALHRDFEILVQDERGLGNGLLLPAGPLREPPERIKQVDFILERLSEQSSNHPSRQPPADSDASFVLEIDSFWQPATNRTVKAAHFGETLAQPTAAVAAIGVPERFFMSLRELGIEPTQTYALADHQAIQNSWLEKLDARTILITEKDAIKLPSLQDSRVWVAITRLAWREDGASTRLLEKLATKGIKSTEQPE